LAGWFAIEDLSPESLRGIQDDFAMLKEMTLTPELCTADAFVTLRIHKISGCGCGEAVTFAGPPGRVIAKLQR